MSNAHSGRVFPGRSAGLEPGGSTLSTKSTVLLVGLLLGSTTINYIDRQVLSVLAPTLRDEFGLSNTGYAAILNAFMITYAAALPLAGWVIDRLGVVRGLSLAVAWEATASMLTSLSRGALSLACFRSLLAVGESGAWPSFAKAVAIWIPVNWRAMAMGVCNAGSSLGATIAPIIVVFLTQHFGWRGAFLVTGSIGCLWVLTFQLFRFLHPQLRARERELSHSIKKEKVTWLTLLRYRQTWAVFVARFLADPLWYFFIFWMPEFLTRERGLQLGQLGALVWIPFVAADIANFGTGWVALALQRRGWSVHKTRKAIMLAGALLAQVGIAAPFAHSLFWTMAFLSIAVFFWMSWSITVQTLPGDIFPARAVASVYGIGACGAMLGVMISIWVIGRVLDATHSYRIVFTLLGLLMPLAFVLGSVLVGKIQPLVFDKEKA